MRQLSNSEPSIGANTFHVASHPELDYKIHGPSGGDPPQVVRQEFALHEPEKPPHQSLKQVHQALPRLVIVDVMSGSGPMSYGIAFIRRHIVVLYLALPWLAGCAAFYPMKGVPVRYLPDELKVGSRNGKRTIDLSLLSQNWNGVHLVDTGDILGVYIGGVLGKIDENPQVLMSQNPDIPPMAGIPVSVREDGTISLPMIGALLVRGKSIRETEDAIREAYTNHSSGKEFLKPDRERILVSLQRPRQTRVLVVRQDSRNEPISGASINLLNIGTAKRGTGRVISLPAYRNDVLNALVMTEGLPGLDAQNEVYIIRRKPDATGPDVQWQDPIDPEELIRKSKALEKPVIRGQNPGGWSIQVEGQNPGQDPNASYYGSAGGPSTPTIGNGMPLQRGYSNRLFPSRKIGQAATDAQRNPASSGFDQAQYRGVFESQEVDRTSYQDPQPWGPPNSMSQQWNMSNPSTVPYSPTPLQSPVQPPVSPYQSGHPVNPSPMQQQNQYQTQQPMNPNQAQQQLNPYQTQPSMNPYQTQQQLNPYQTPYQTQQQTSPYPTPQLQPQPDYSNSRAMPNWPPQQTGGPAPGVGTQFPVPGYSLPAAGPSGTTGMGVNGSLGDSRGTDQQGEPAPQDIGLVDGRRIIRIPIRMGPDEHIDIRKEDIILHDGDIVFIEARDTEVFFTGGLLGGGQFTLPRDFDLDILQALSIAGSRVGTSGAARQIGGVSALNSDVTISPSNVIVIRKLPEGGEIAMKIDLYQARNDMSERIIIQPGDYIYLQYTPMEAIGAFIDRHLLEGALFGVFSQQLVRPTN